MPVTSRLGKGPAARCLHSSLLPVASHQEALGAGSWPPLCRRRCGRRRRRRPRHPRPSSPSPSPAAAALAATALACRRRPRRHRTRCCSVALAAADDDIAVDLAADLAVDLAADLADSPSLPAVRRRRLTSPSTTPTSRSPTSRTSPVAPCGVRQLQSGADARVRRAGLDAADARSAADSIGRRLSEVEPSWLV